MSKPGIGGSPFYIQFDKDWYNKGDILDSSYNDIVQLEVIKVYRGTKFRIWWNTYLSWICSLRMYQVKVVDKKE